MRAGRLHLDAQPAHAGAARAPRSRTTPGTCASTTSGQYRELLEPHFARVELLGLFHARKLRAHELAIRLGWDRVHPALRPDQAVLRPLHPGDRGLGLRACRRRRPGPGAGLPRRLPHR